MPEGRLAGHIAKITRLKHPKQMISGEVRPVFARMRLLASHLAEAAATAIEHRDPLSGDRLAQRDTEVDALRRCLFGILFATDWPHGVEPTVDAALIGRYSERFADHAVAIARQVCYLTAGRKPQPHAEISPAFLGPKDSIMLTWSTMLRRRPRPPAKTQEQVIQADGVTLDLPRRRAQVDGYLVHLPAREAALLGVLLTHPGQIVYRPALAAAAGDIDQTHHRDLDRLMHRLHRRIQVTFGRTGP